MLRQPLRQIRFHSKLALAGYNSNEVTVAINGRTCTFNNVFLRDACQSPDSVDPISSQKLFTTADAATGLQINAPPVVEDSLLKIQWSNNGKLTNSVYPVSFLENYSINKRLGKFFDKDRKLWDKQELENNFASLNMDYNDILTTDNSFFQTLYNLNRYGLTFVNNIPTPQISDMTEDNATQWPVYKIAEKFGYIKKTFYGTLFDVKNKKEKATNIAYTNTFLPLHMDLLYYESPRDYSCYTLSRTLHWAAKTSSVTRTLLLSMFGKPTPGHTRHSPRPQSPSTTTTTTSTTTTSGR